MHGVAKRSDNRRTADVVSAWDAANDVVQIVFVRLIALECHLSLAWDSGRGTSKWSSNFGIME